jgi:hypothetical protein
MSLARYTVPPVLLVVGIALILGGCKEDDIPATPDPPFLFTEMILSNGVTPDPSKTLAVGQNVTTSFQINYTLSPQDDQGRSKLALFADVYSENATGIITSLTPFPGTPVALTSSGGVVSKTLTFTVPTGARFVTVEAFLDTVPFSNPVLKLDSRTWTVQ